MRYITGTSGGGQIIGSRGNTKVFSIEFHAQASNTGRAVVGDSMVSLTNGMGLQPDDRHGVDFMPGGDKTMSVDLKDFYVQVSGGDKVDWAAQVEP